MGAHAVRLSNVDIDNALKNKEFEVLFQPIFDLGNGALARVEAFVRWRHPKLGVLPPGAFISFFETQGRMSELTRYVLSGAIAAYLDWRGPSAPGFSINLALSDLGDDAFANHFTKVMRDNNFPPDLVTLECPMPRVDLEIETAAAQFDVLAKTGARLAIEVRGRANDLLRNIDPFPFDEIKTGGSAILRFARTVRGPGLSAIADLLDIASRANAAITAVGVEDQASLSALRGLGFTAVQGNHLAKVADLDGIRPPLVNEVRERLELEPLDAESLRALFRTDALGKDEAASEDEETLALTSDAEVTADSEAAAEKAPRAKRTKTKTTKAKSGDAESDKTTGVKKAAPIDRAKAKLAHARQKARRAALSGDEADSPFPPNAAPRDLQKRLSEEFSGEDASDETFDASITEADEQEAVQQKDADMPEKTARKKATADDIGDDAVEDDQRSEIDEAVEAIPETQDTETDEIQFEMRDDDGDDSDDIEVSDADAIDETDLAAPPELELPEPEFAETEIAASLESDDIAADHKPIEEQSIDAPLSQEDQSLESDAPEIAAMASGDISLSVGAARAYFQPGMRVGNPALRTSESLTEFPAIKASPETPPESGEDQIAAQESDDVDLQSEETADLSAWISDDAASGDTHDAVTAETTAVSEGALPENASPEALEIGDLYTEEEDSRFDYLDVEEAPTTSEEATYAEEGVDDIAAEAPEEVSFDVEDSGDVVESVDDEQAGDIKEAGEGEEAALPKRRKKRKKNFLTRKYRLMPTHFWPRSWKRSWARAAAEKAELKAAKAEERAERKAAREAEKAERKAAKEAAKAERQKDKEEASAD